MGGQMGGPQIYSKQGFLLYPPPTDDNDKSKTTNKQTNKQNKQTKQTNEQTNKQTNKQTVISPVLGSMTDICGYFFTV